MTDFDATRPARGRTRVALMLATLLACADERTALQASDTAARTVGDAGLVDASTAPGLDHGGGMDAAPDASASNAGDAAQAVGDGGEAAPDARDGSDTGAAPPSSAGDAGDSGGADVQCPVAEPAADGGCALPPTRICSYGTCAHGYTRDARCASGVWRVMSNQCDVAPPQAP